MSKTIATLLARIDELISRAQAIQKKVVTVHRSAEEGAWGGLSVRGDRSWEEYPEEESQIWQQHFTTLIYMVLTDGAPNRDQANKISTYNSLKRAVDEGRAFLIALREDLSHGYLTPAFQRIDAEITVDYLDMAAALLAEEKSTYEHIPAAVLAGAVLERGLRTLCGRQKPPLPVVDNHGGKKTMGPLIDDLKRAGVLSELKAKQLRAWADVRNAAAHGEINLFKKNDVAAMLDGITHFLADHLG